MRVFRWVYEYWHTTATAICDEGRNESDQGDNRIEGANRKNWLFRGQPIPLDEVDQDGLRIWAPGKEPRIEMDTFLFIWRYTRTDQRK